MREELYKAAREHHAILRSAEVRSVLSAGQVRNQVRKGVLERVHPNVFRVGGAPITHRQQLLAAVYAGGDGAVGSHRSGAAMLGMLEQWPDTPEISVRPPRYPRLKGVIVHRSLDLHDDFVVVVDNIPVTSPAFTLIDLGAVAGPRVVERALERATITGLTTVAEVEALHRRLRRSGRSGAGSLAIVLDDLGLRSDDVDSRLEHVMARLFKRYGLPAAVFHYVVHDEHGIPLAEPDFAYPKFKIIIEVDGYDAHGSPRALQVDLARQNQLVLRGWTILRFTWNDVTRRPTYVADQIRQVLRAVSVAKQHLARSEREERGVRRSSWSGLPSRDPAAGA